MSLLDDICLLDDNSSLLYDNSSLLDDVVLDKNTYYNYNQQYDYLDEEVSNNMRY